MTDKQQSDALELASVAESADLAGYPTAKKANAYCLCLLEDCAQMIRRLHAENETLRSGYAAARLEIESLRAAQPAGAQQPGAAYAALPYKQAVGSKNCMQCCVSYMLGLPLNSVPDFATDGGWELFSEFVESKGYAAVMLPGNCEFEADYLASGTTERGTSHMVVMNDGKLVHDPHPSNAGIVEVQCVWLLTKKATPQGHHDERAAFEASAKAYTSNVSFERDEHDEHDYADMTASLLWHGWKLRAARAPADSVLEGAAYAALPDVDALAQEIRRVDGAHKLGAGALAEALMPFLRASRGQAPAQAASSAVLKAIREANMQLVRTGDDAFMLVPYKAVTAQAAESVLEDAIKVLRADLKTSAKEIADEYAEDAARWRDWSQAFAEASAAPEDTVFMKAFEDAIGDSDAPFTAEQFTSWVDAARKQGGAT